MRLIHHLTINKLQLQKEKFHLSTYQSVLMIIHSSLSLVLSVVIYAELFKFTNTNTILFWSLITTLEVIPNGTISECQTPKQANLTDSISSILWSLTHSTIMVCDLLYTLKLKQKDLAVAGSEAEETFAITRTQWKERMLGTTTLWHGLSLLSTTLMWSICHTVIHTPLQICAGILTSSRVILSVKIEWDVSHSAKQSLVTTVTCSSLLPSRVIQKQLKLAKVL